MNFFENKMNLAKGLHERNGFSLVEMTIIILVMGVLFSQSTALVNFIEEKNLEGFINKIYTMLETAKKMATAVERNNLFCNGINQKISGYGLSLINNEINLCVYCMNSDLACNSIYKIPIPSGYFISTDNNSSVIRFNILTGYTSQSSITIKDKVSKRCGSITISQIGLIEKTKLYNCQ